VLRCVCRPPSMSVTQWLEVDPVIAQHRADRVWRDYP